MSTEDEVIEAVSQREFARRVGVSHAAIQQAIERGTITEASILPDGRLSLARALVDWAARDTRIVESPKLAEVRARLLELEYQRALGHLLDAEEVERANSRIFRTTRDQLLNIADQLAPIVAVERDPARVRDLIFKAIETALHTLSDWAKAEASKGEGTPDG
jgi:hypothetical protein